MQGESRLSQNDENSIGRYLARTDIDEDSKPLMFRSAGLPMNFGRTSSEVRPDVISSSADIAVRNLITKAINKEKYKMSQDDVHQELDLNVEKIRLKESNKSHSSELPTANTYGTTDANIHIASLQMFTAHKKDSAILTQGINSKRQRDQTIWSSFPVGLNPKEKITKKQKGELEQPILKTPRTEITAPTTQTRKVKLQSEGKNHYGHLMSAIQKGCRSYFQEPQGIKLACIIKMLGSETKGQQKLFKEFIKSYKNKDKAMTKIVELLERTEENRSCAPILLKLISAFLSDEYEDDFNKWLKSTRMEETTRQKLVNRKKDNEKFFEKNLIGIK